VRPAMEFMAAGATALAAAKATTPPGAVAMAVERLTPEGSAVAAAASTSRVFLLQLPEHAFEELAASPPGPSPCYDSRTAGRACACPTHRRL
jgi:hypothetical protein